MKKYLFFCLTACCSIIAHAQYDSAVRYRMASPTFLAASDSLISEAIAASSGATGEGSEANTLLEWQYFMGSRLSNNVPLGADMYAPLARATSSYFNNIGAYCTSGGGFNGNWTCVGPFTNYYGMGVYQTQGRIDALWVNPINQNTILAGADGGGLWKSTNCGVSWHNITDGNGSNNIASMLGVYSIAVNPLDTNIIYIAQGISSQYKKSTGYNLGLAYSSDGGNTWFADSVFNDTIGTVLPNIVKIAYMPGTQKLFAVDNFYGVFYKANPSDTWHNITSNAMLYGSPTFGDIAFTNLNPGKIVVTTSAVGYSTLYADTSSLWVCDTSSIPTWTQLKMPIAHCTQPYRNNYVPLSISISSLDTVYMRMAVYDSILSSNTILFLKTPYGSFSPTILNTNFNPNVEQFAVSQANPQVIYTANYSYQYPCGECEGTFTQSTIEGTDASSPWPEISYNNHFDGRCLYIWKSYQHPDSDIVYFGCDGGVSLKSQGATQTSSITGDSLTVTEFYGFGNTEADEDYMVAGAQDNGEYSYIKNRTTPWTDDYNYDDGENAKMMHDSIGHPLGEVNSGSPYELVQWAFSGTTSSISSFPSPPIDTSCSVNRPIYYDLTDTAYIGYNHIWQETATGSGSWTRPFVRDPVDYDATHYQQKYVVDFYIDNNNKNNAYIAYRDASGTNPLANVTVGKLFVSATAKANPPTWTNITPPSVDSDCINSIIVDPNHSNRIWVGLGNINYGSVTTPPASMANRVLYSDNSGNTWRDISAGLPALPVNKLLLRNGSNDELFAGTDVGVFVWNATSGSWQCFNNNMPPCIVMDMEFNYCANKLRVATYGRGIWESQLDTLSNIPDSMTTQITANTTWNQNMWLENSVTVDSGVTLTIYKDTIHIPQNGRILVKPGGRLVVDSADITNSCASCFWHGLEAQGNVSLPQTIANQGWITIENNSTIENAMNGVCNRNEDIDWLADGGIIEAYNSTFKNNITDVSFYEYDNYHPYAGATDEVDYPNISYFSNCTFLLDSAFKGDAQGIRMNNMVYMRRVDGVTFAGCQWLNRDTATLNKGLGDGIYEISCGITVQPYYPGMYWTATPQRSIIRGFFNGLDMNGASNVNEMASQITGVDFDSCGVGERVSVQDNIATTNCTFRIGDGTNVTDPGNLATYNGCNHNIGIFTENVNEFYTSGNTFTGTPITASQWFNIGIAVANEPMGNTINYNVFDSLSEGVLSIGHNFESSWGPWGELGGVSWQLLEPTGVGLEILCNTFHDNYNDINISSDGGSLPQGINVVQENIDSEAAGNTFTGGSTQNIVNNCNSIIYKVDSAGDHYCWPGVVSANVTLDRTTINSSCGSGYTFSSGGGSMVVGGSAAELPSAERAVSDYNAALWPDVDNYRSYIDFGNTDSLRHVIDTSSNAIALMSAMLAGSPWLSQAVVKKLAASSQLSYSNLLTVLEANPDLWRDYDFLNDMENNYGILPGDAATLATLAFSVSTPRTALENTLRQLRTDIDYETNVIMTALKTATDPSVSITDSTFIGYCHDSTNVYYYEDSNRVYGSMDSMNYWLGQAHRMWAVYAQVGLAYQQGQFSAGSAIMSQTDSLVRAYGASHWEQVTDSILWAQLSEAGLAGRDLFMLSSNEIGLLDTSSTDIFSADNARKTDINITHSGGGGIPGPPISLPNNICLIIDPYLPKKDNNTSQNNAPITNVNSSDITFTAYPNPANDMVTFAWQMTKGDGITVMVTNILGEQVFARQSPALVGSMAWDTHNVAAGLYIYHAAGAAGNISMGKIVVAR